MQTQTIGNDINHTIENIYDFIKNNEKINEDFTEYKKTLGIYNSPNSKTKEYTVNYIFERAVPNFEQNPIMIYNEKNATKLSKALEKSFISMFEIKRILKNGFEVYNLINEKSYNLTITTKMTDYRGFGIGQYIVARIFEFENENYIIEIQAHLSSNQKEEAMRYAMAKIIQEPYLVYEDNIQKEQEITKNIEFMYEKFISAFGTDEIITTSKFADDIIGQFNDFVENGTPVNIQDKTELPQTFEYFEISDLQNNYDNFVEKSLDGFSSHKKIYDTGIIYDKNYGLYVIPFYKTISKILEENSLENVKNAKECVKYFIETATISTNILKRLYEKYPNFMDLANKALDKNLTFEELQIEYKPEYIRHKIYSQTTILYNSKVFSNTLGIVVENEKHSDIDYSNVKRNDPCPCGSGKKFKHCCMK